MFVKSAEEPNLAGWLRREHEVYSALSGSFIPELVGWDDDGVRPVLAIEDLSDADWTPRWDAARVAAVLAALGELAGASPPPDTPPVRESFAELFDRWRVVEADPGPFLSAGLRDAAWLDRALPVILAAVDSAPVDGDCVCHLDVRSDNLCFRDGRAVLVDWNWTSLANPAVDVAAWLPSLRVEGGPQPWDVLPDAGSLGRLHRGRLGGGRRASRRRRRPRPCATFSGGSSPSRSTGSTGNCSSEAVGERLELGRVQADLARLDRGLHFARELAGFAVLVRVEHGRERCDHARCPRGAGCRRSSGCACRRSTGRPERRPRW